MQFIGGTDTRVADSHTHGLAANQGPASRVRGVLVGVIVVLLVLELGLRFIEKRLPEPLEYYSAAAQEAVREMNVLHSTGVHSDLVFIGDSTVLYGIVVQPLEAELRSVAEAHNVGLSAAKTPIVERWLIDEVLPRLRPKRVVWGLSSIDFNPNWKAADEAYKRARATRSGHGGTIDRLLARHLLLVRYRSILRDPVTALDSVLDRREPGLDSMPQEVVLQGLPRLQLDQTAAALERLKTHPLNDWTLGADELEAFRRTLAELTASGVEVVIVFMPVPAEHIAAHPDGESDYDKFRATISEEARKLGVVVLDRGSVFGRDSFTDFTHLTPDAAEDFSELLANDLAGIGW